MQAHRDRAAQSGVVVLNSGDHGLRGNRRGTGRKTEALQDSANGLGRMDGGHDPHAPTTAMALENVHFPHAFHELSPRIVAWMATTGQGLLVMRGLFAGAASVMSNGIHGVKCCCCQRNDRRPPTGCRGQDSVVSDLVEPGRRNQSSELGNELQPFEDDMRGAVAPTMLEMIQRPAIR